MRLSDREGSARDVADELEEPTNRVANHFRVLSDLGLIELVRQERVHGAVRRVYRGAGDQFTDEHAEALPLAARRSMYTRILEKLQADIRAAERDGGFDDASVHVSRIPLALDARGFDEVRDILAEAFERVMKARADAAARLTEGADETAINTIAALLHFHTDEPHGGS